MPPVQSSSVAGPPGALLGEAPGDPRSACGSAAGPWRLLVAGILGALLSVPWMAHFDERFPVENLNEDMTNRIRNNREDPIAWAKERENRFTSLYQTAVVCLAGFGCAVGGMLGFAEGAARRSVARAALGLFGGALAGAIFAAAGGYAEASVAMGLEKSGLDRTYRAILGHAIAWSFCAVGLSIAVGVAARSPKFAARVLAPAILAGVLAELIYSPVAAMLFQLYKSDLPIPEGTSNKLLFACLAGGLMALSIGRVRVPAAVPAMDGGQARPEADVSAPA
jgi:hypothetical protein